MEDLGSSLTKSRHARLAQMVCIKRGNSPLRKENRSAQRVSLKQPEAFRYRDVKFFLSLDFLGDRDRGEALHTAHNRSALVAVSEAEIDFDIVRKCEQDIHLFGKLKVVERDLVAQRLHFAAGGHHLRAGLDGFQQLQHDARGQQRQRPSCKRFEGAIDKGARATGELVESMEQPVVDHGLGGCIRIAGEAVFPLATGQGFVAEDLSPTIEDRLKRNKAVAPASDAAGAQWASIHSPWASPSRRVLPRRRKDRKNFIKTESPYSQNLREMIGRGLVNLVWANSHLQSPIVARIRPNSAHSRRFGGSQPGSADSISISAASSSSVSLGIAIPEVDAREVRA